MADRMEMSPRKLEKLLVYLGSQEKPARQIDIQREVGVPTSLMRLIQKELSDLLVVEGDQFLLRKEQASVVRDLHSARTRQNEYFMKKSEEGMKLLEQVERERKRSKRNMDQFRALPVTAIDRIKILYERGELEGRKLLFMGDNDLTSVAAAVMCLAEEIVVLDIDPKLTSIIEEVSRRENFEIFCIKYDARKTLPENLKSRFDVTITDPPYTPEGAGLFVSRCIQGNGRRNGVVVVSYGHSIRSRERALSIQEMLTKQGLLMEEIIPELGKYHSAQSIGCRSSLYICRITPKTRPLIKDEYRGQPIYTA